MDDKNRSSVSAFAGRKVGGVKKYDLHHMETLRQDKADETTKRIEQFMAQNKTVAWAKRALEFCSYEEENGKDIEDICPALNKLPAIKSEAKRILDEEEQRIIDDEAKLQRKKKEQEIKDAERKRQLELLKMEQDLQSQAQEDQFIANAEQLIASLSVGVKNRVWVDSVNSTIATVSGLPAALYGKIKNRNLLENYKNEALLVTQALEVDDEIIDLKDSRTKNKAWANKVFDLEEKLDGPYEKYLLNKDDYYEILTLAGRVFYAPELALVEGLLKRAERGEVRECLDDLPTVTNAVEKLRGKIYMDEYIDNFEARWVDTADAIARLRERDKKAEAERKKKEKAEEAERLRYDKAVDASIRIKQFMERERTVAWANEAFEFCKYEERNGKDIVDICQELSLLKTIKADAQKILDDEKIRRHNKKLQDEEIARQKELAKLAAIKRKKTITLILYLSFAGIIAASVLVGIFTKGLASNLVFGVGCSLGVCGIWFMLSRALVKKEFRSYIYLALMIVQLIMGAVGFFIDHSGVLSLSIVGFTIVAFIINLINWGGPDGLEYFESDSMVIGGNIAAVILSLALYFVIGNYVGAIIAAVIVLAVSIVCGIVMCDMDPYEGGLVLLIVQGVLMVLSCVGMFFGWKLLIVSSGALLGSVIGAFVGDSDLDGTFAVGFGGTIAGIICLIIAICINVG
ncbi:MAG: hypothetical protein IKT32_04165 [Clostridia bacterium]|nr:hypothetical protein [Clostridia bacterium]